MKTPEERINELERRVSELEKYKPLPPCGPKPGDYPGETPWILPIIRHPIVPEFDGCKTCGIKLEGVMGYCCQHPDCPSRITCTCCQR